MEILTNQEKTVMWITGVMSGLAQEGLVEGGHKLTGKGLEIYQSILDEGFCPNPDDIETVVHEMVAEEDADGILTLIQHYYPEVFKEKF